MTADRTEPRLTDDVWVYLGSGISWRVSRRKCEYLRYRQSRARIRAGRLALTTSEAQKEGKSNV